MTVLNYALNIMYRKYQNYVMLFLLTREGGGYDNSLSCHSYLHFRFRCTEYVRRGSVALRPFVSQVVSDVVEDELPFRHLFPTYDW